MVWLGATGSLRGVHGHLPVDQSSSVSLREQPGHNGVPRTVATETSVTFPDGLPRTERFRKVTPGNPRPIPIDDAFQNAAVVLERTTRAVLRGRHQRLEASPLTVRQHGSTRHGLSLSDRARSIRRHALDGSGTRLYDKALPHDEAKLRALIQKLKARGTVLLVVDQPETVGALPVAYAYAYA